MRGTAVPRSPRPVALSERAQALYQEHLQSVHAGRDRVFAWLLCVQWAIGILLAFVYSPYGWEGKVRSPNQHVPYALIFGALITLPPVLFTVFRPGRALTRHVVAIAQMLWSALLIHLTGGRIETHFHVFGSLAFLAFYRDWKVLLTATVAVAGEHMVRGLAWPESIYGIVNPEWWRFLEHAWWVVFEDTVLVMSVLESRREMRTLALRQADMESLYGTIERRVEERTQELAASRDQFQQLVETTKTIPFEMEPREQRFTYVGPQAVELLSASTPTWKAAGFLAERLHPEDREECLRALLRVGSEHTEIEFRLRKEGGLVWVRMIVSAAARGSGPDTATILRGVLLDVTETRQLEADLRQAQKLESVGRLAAGVAHEINTPVQFVSDSVHFVRDSFGEIGSLLEKYGGLRATVARGGDASALVSILQEAEEETDLPYLLENVPKALERSLDGLERVTSIVRSLKEFSHPDQKEMAQIDLNQAIQSTLTVARNEYKYVAELETDLGELPRVTCLAGEVNQAILNIVINAAHAIGDVVKGSDAKGRITVRTRQDGDRAVITIADTGGGIPEHIRERIFDPFFTTKEVGKGTGQGLAIARSVIREKHGGELTFETEMGKGTTFMIALPIQGKQGALQGVAA